VVSAHLGLPPVATCAALILWNFALLSPNDDVSDPDNLFALQTFTGTPDESWFYVVSDAMEARGGRMIPVMLGAVESAQVDDACKVSQALCALTECLTELEVLLGRMYEKCNPDVFYNKIRPILAGSKNASAAGLPNGVFYDEGEGKGKWRQLSGASNAQSSLIPFFDIVLGVDHHPTGQAKTTEKNSFMQASPHILYCR
jgi:indoleamine 2,3-dioxygenase